MVYFIQNKIILIINKMSYKQQVANKLANETMNYIETIGYLGSSFNSIYQSILSSNIKFNSTKMQFKIPKNEYYRQKIINKNTGDISIFTPRRVVTTFETEYSHSKLMRLAKQEEEKIFQSKIYGYDSSLVCRNARANPQMKEVLNNLYRRGEKYGLMGTITYDLPELDPSINYYGKVIKHARIPIFIFYKLSNEERKIIDEFCGRHQIPSKEKLDKIIELANRD